MVETSRPGCGVWIIGAIFALFASAWFFGVNSSNAASQTIVDMPTPTPAAPLILTLEPQETDAYFVVENNQISFSYFQTLGMPCYYTMIGRVLDLNGKPYTD